MFVKPAGAQLQLLVRVPLKTIRDLEFPERADGYLDVEKLAPQLGDAAKVWIADFVEIQEGDTRLPNPRIAATQLSLESDRSFASFDAALDHVTGPKLSGSSHVVWNQLLLDVLLEYPIQSDRSRFSIRPGLERFAARVVTVLRFLPPGGAVRAYEFTRRSGDGAARSTLASGRAGIHQAGLLPYSRRHRPPVVSALPRDPVCAACGRCFWWSPPSPWPTPSR